MNLTDMSERAYWAEFAKRPGMFIGGTGLRGIEAYLMGTTPTRSATAARACRAGPNG